MTEIEQMLERYASAVRAKDVDAFCALYADDVVLFDMWETWEIRGLDAWRANVEEWFGSLGDESVAVSFDELETRARTAHMVVRYAGLSAAGDELRAMWNRMTWVVENGKVVHEHSSAPASFETGAVLKQR
jgi:ketosteroid isomerase-like protein